SLCPPAPGLPSAWTDPRRGVTCPSSSLAPPDCARSAAACRPVPARITTIILYEAGIACREVMRGSRKESIYCCAGTIAQLCGAAERRAWSDPFRSRCKITSVVCERGSDRVCPAPTVSNRRCKLRPPQQPHACRGGPMQGDGGGVGDVEAGEGAVGGDAG